VQHLLMTARPATRRWADALASWAVPDEILAQAPVPPWVHPPKLFEVKEGPSPETPSHRAARLALGEGGSVLDVGCGGGASSVPLVPEATRIVGVDESAAMLTNFAAACDRVGVAHEEHEGRWPDIAGTVPGADVVVSHHTAYNVPDIAEFLEALTAHARRLVVVELPDRHPMSPLNGLWKHFWDLDRPTEPSADLFVEVVKELGWEPTVERVERAPRKGAMDHAAYVEFLRQRLCLTPDRDPEVEAVMGDVQYAVNTIVTVAWPPPH
jgi:SAM-dependent methyltransferase